MVVERLAPAALIVREELLCPSDRRSKMPLYLPVSEQIDCTRASSSVRRIAVLNGKITALGIT